MKRNINLGVLVAVILFLMAGNAQADLINGGFESGLDDWNVLGTVSAVSESYIVTNHFTPDEGDLMASISDPTTGGYYIDNILSQNFSHEENEIYLDLRYNFWTFDSGNNDMFSVFLNGEESFSLSAADANITALNGLEYTGWTGVSFLLPTDRDGNYIADISLAFSAGNTGDPLHNSGVFLDCLAIGTAPEYQVANVPIPVSIWLLGSGLVGILFMKKRDRV